MKFVDLSSRGLVEVTAAAFQQSLWRPHARSQFGSGYLGFSQEGFTRPAISTLYSRKSLCEFTFFQHFHHSCV